MAVKKTYKRTERPDAQHPTATVKPHVNPENIRKTTTDGESKTTPDVRPTN